MSKKKTRTNIDLAGPITMGKNLAVSANVHLGGASRAATAQSQVMKPKKNETITTKNAAAYAKIVRGGPKIGSTPGDSYALQKSKARRAVKSYKKDRKLKTLAANVSDVV